MRAGVGGLLLVMAAGCGGGGSVADGPESDPGAFLPTEPVLPYDGGPTDVPLGIVPVTAVVPDGGTEQAGFRLSVPVTLGDAGAIRAFLDTGSEGVQVLESALPQDALAAIGSLGGSQLFEEFQSGIEAIGVVGQATVTLGNRTTPTPIPIIVIQGFSCQTGAACSSLTAPLSSYLFGTYQAILGVGLRNSPPVAAGVGSPIPQLPGQPSYVVQLPGFGADAGTLHIGPGPDEVAAYQLFELPPMSANAPLPNGTPAWNDTALPACIRAQAAAQAYCANGLLDTGSPETLVLWSGQVSDTTVPPGSDVTVTIGNSASPIAQFDVNVGSPPQIGLDVFAIAPPVPGSGNAVNLGLTVFFRYNVLFDAVSGRVGLLTH